jgi:hypothetical protein
LQLKSTDAAYAAGLNAIARGDLQVKPGEYAQTLGTFVDKRVRDQLRAFARAESINDSSASNLWAINRRITSEFGIGIPDNRLGLNLYADTTLARKNGDTLQLRMWNEIQRGHFLMIRPSVLGGPYVIPRAQIPALPRPVGRGT